ncbi:ubiquinone biosynthesis monooxygenase COQ6 [Pseudohyphozyma bogoriensis]|nr:ubiquinone biosynthesis monooxygenase COQ6 [Pseudohyphozyma bogoriensis]
MSSTRALRQVGRTRQLVARSAARSFSSSTPTRSSATPEEHDIVVVGGGPAGLALAAALASSDAISSTHKITLLEGSQLESVAKWAPEAGQWSNRVSSITAENVAFLSDVGVWSHVEQERVRPVEEMQVWDGLSDARITFSSPYASTSSAIATPPTIKPMATLVENLNLQRGSLRYLDTKKKVEILDGRKVVGVEEGLGGWPVVKVDAGQGEPARELRARLLIGADGFNSPVKTYSKIDTFGFAYDIHGVVATLEVSPLNGGEGMTTAWQRFLPEGPIAFLPLSDTTASLVWSTTPALAAKLKTIPLDLLPSLINAAFTFPHSSLLALYSHLLSPSYDPATLSSLVTSLTPPPIYTLDETPDPIPPLVASVQKASVASFPLKLSHADSYLGLPKDGRDLRTVLVGDAAHTVNPLAGQGLNMGLGDVKSLVDTLESTVLHGGDVGSYLNLKPYPRARYLPNHLLLSTTDHLSSLYASQSPPLVWARSTGLEIINELDGIKNLIMGGAGAHSGEKSAGPWGAVASALEGVQGAVDTAKGVGAMVGMGLAQRFAQMGGRR